MIDSCFILWLLYFRVWLSFRSEFDAETARKLFRWFLVLKSVGMSAMILNFLYKQWKVQKHFEP